MTVTYNSVFKDWCLDFIRPPSERRFERIGEYYGVKGTSPLDIMDNVFYGEKGSLNENDYQANILINKIYRTARKCFVVGFPFVSTFFISHPFTISNLLLTGAISTIGILYTQPHEINFSPGAAKITMLVLQNVGLAVTGNALSWGIQSLVAL